MKRAATAGFSLIEVMVALIIISIGLLGIAKLQAVALSSTGTAGKRGLAAIEAASIAAAMHADRAYWSAGVIATSTTLSGAGVSAANDGALMAPVDCSTVRPCTTVQMAAYDLSTVANSLQSILPGYTGTIACNQTVAPPPVVCAITLTWIENVVGANTQGVQAGAAAAFQIPTYTLYVEP
ncbi:MAG TPA: type IV pilus modification protein PilV [Steroidobacteraceae bacterium]|jgi:type IV pilus assembly protein PilV